VEAIMKQEITDRAERTRMANERQEDLDRCDSMVFSRGEREDIQREIRILRNFSVRVYWDDNAGRVVR
jgi:hypothetical protein